MNAKTLKFRLNSFEIPPQHFVEPVQPHPLTFELISTTDPTERRSMQAYIDEDDDFKVHYTVGDVADWKSVNEIAACIQVLDTEKTRWMPELIYRLMADVYELSNPEIFNKKEAKTWESFLR